MEDAVMMYLPDVFRIGILSGFCIATLFNLTARGINAALAVLRKF